MTDQTPPPPDNYKVGRGRPPRETQFKKGQSGNPKGRPKARGPVRPDLKRILDSPVTVAQNGIEKKMSPKEVALHNFLKKAVKGDLRAIKHLFSQFAKYDAIEWPKPENAGGVIELPKSMPYGMANIMLRDYGFPPWTPQQKVKARAEYIANRSEKERLFDEAWEYEDL